MIISIIGTGYVGLSTAAVFAEHGHRVNCYDVDDKKIKILANGGCTIFEEGLPQLLAKNKERLSFTVKNKNALQSADIIIIAVGTPERQDGSANLSYVYTAVDDIVRERNEAYIILKSTVPVGTNDRLEAYAKSKGANFEFISNPEFLSQGTAVNDMLYPSRIIIGVKTMKARELMTKLYSSFNSPLLIIGRRSAEMVKYASNDFLALKISYINEIANLCEKLGANVEEVALGMGYDDRIGNRFLKAGVGYGGSCFPKDTKALHWLAGFNDCELKTIKAAIDVNENQKIILVKKAKKYYESFNGKTVAILGLAFKPGTDDLREAPSIVNIRLLTDEGAVIKAYDPIAGEAVKRQYPNIVLCETLKKALENADLCFIFTEWEEIKALQPEDFGIMKNKFIFDGRNCFNVTEMKNAGLTYISIGRG